MKVRPGRFIGIILLCITSLVMNACQPETTYTRDESETIARNFVQNEATFRYDGIADTLQLVNTSQLSAGRWEFIFRYDSRAAGYGDRSGQILAQVITPHEARVAVTNYQVTRGVLDDQWDMIKQLIVGTPPPPKPAYSVYELEYLLFARFDNIFYVDHDFYPIAREGQEEINAQAQFADVRANTDEFAAIQQHLGLPDKAEYTDQEKLLIYREHKKLTLGVQMSAAGNTYDFVLRVGENQGERIEGTITNSGEITVTKREPSFNTYPICLAKGTLIDTPDGPVAVEQIQKGMTVWTLNSSGGKLAAVVTGTVATPVPASFQVVTVNLSDGRMITASWGHPTVENRAVGSYRVGDTLDGATVVNVAPVAYGNDATYDILPGGTTGLYWANGILLKSTLAAG